MRERITIQPGVTAKPQQSGETAPLNGGQRSRVLIYSHDGTGLGHLRITLGIAKELAERRPDATLLLLTGSLQTHAYELPRNLDYVKLPAMPKRHLYEGLPETAGSARGLTDVVSFREAVAHATVKAFAPHLIVVDHAPVGLFREMARAIKSADRATPRPALVLLMRDITFGPEQTRTIWHNEGVYPVLNRVYDQILVYGNQAIFDPIQEYGLSPAAAAKVSFCGYLQPPPPVRRAAAIRSELGVGHRRLAVVTVGGGADGADVLRTYLAMLRHHPPTELVSYIVTGPLLPEAERAEIHAMASGLADVTLTPFSPDLVSHLHAADLIVTMGGYNALCETVSAGKRAVVVPRAPGPEEQLIRARRFARHGLVTMVAPSELTPERLSRVMREELARGTSPPRLLEFDGVRSIVDRLAAAIPP